ncbi:hypothetical protein PT974_10644 [Cladobotryum mycophilum]|uniref:DUF1760-domain-containing protein n=1 Tax=Cladobotryum mycophilum TaxID=491253 RepID=A0ABR0SAF9_9HYPO
MAETASLEEVVQRLQDSRPPATDVATYLTILEMSLSTEILPALQEILEDVKLTNDIGWDLVDMLIPIEGSEECLESVARLGNPREVILKVLEAMDKAANTEGNDEEEGEGREGEEETKASKSFVTLCGMLGILHKRLQSLRREECGFDGRRHLPSPVFGQSNTTPLPSRKSSTMLDTPFFQDSDPSKRAPDPEADRSDRPSANEPQLVIRLLQSFITCVIEAYVNVNSLEWASRLLEYTYPERIVTGRKTMMQAFKETVELQAKDALVGQLVSLASDLGLANLPSFKMQELLEAPICRDPLSEEFEGEDPEQIKLSTGGLLCLNAYWMFAADVFDADRGLPDRQLFPRYMLPEHHRLLKNFLEDEPQGQVMSNPGSVEALIVMAISLHGRNHILDEKKSTESGTEFMPYHHLLTLISVFHQNLRVRNAATVISGAVLHADPEEDSRLAILEDLLENCIFASLQACAVTWLREEIIAAKKAGSKGRFASPECFETIQYTLFPDLSHLKEADVPTILEFWSSSAPLHLQVANFALFLFGGEDYKGLAPAGMAAAIEHRYVDPLVHAAKVLEKAVEKKEIDVAGGGMLMELSILTDTLGRVPLQ